MKKEVIETMHIKKTKKKKKDIKCTKCEYFRRNSNECAKTTRKQNVVSLTILTEDIAPSWCPFIRSLGGRPRKKHSARWILTKYLDVLWAKAVKLRANNQCEVVTDRRCPNKSGEGQGKGLNAHHVIGRSNLNVRWDVNNGVALCVKHHVFSIWSAHKNPFWFLQKIIDIRGKMWYDRINKKALRNNGIAKYTMEELEEVKMGLLKIIKKEGG
ncbi:hypothetical protein KAU34_10430 [candidate division WOR-3 bacterium]|nr:hypothetical protein [candidate division WOR-3 bacterium]